MKRSNRALTCMAIGLGSSMLLPVGMVHGAEEIQIIRQQIAGGGRVPAGVVPFTTFQQEQLALTAALPCKWISRDGRLGPSYGNQHYDFLCKGGDYAGVSLYMNKGRGDTVANVKLLYREFPENVNPNAGEAIVAQEYLAHVVGRFVPAARAGAVMDAFWGRGDKDWVENGLRMSFTYERPKGQTYVLRRLEIVGDGKAVTPQTVPMIAVPATPVAPVAPVATGLTKPGVAPASTLPAAQIVTPMDAGLAKPEVIISGTQLTVPKAKPAIPDNTYVMPQGVLPMPGLGANKTGSLTVPINAPAGGVQSARPEEIVKPEEQGTLEQATPAELNTAPAPESKVQVGAPPAISASMVPNEKDVQVGTPAKAPSNFDIYNKAVELTKSTEAKAQIHRVEEAKVTASKPTLAPGDKPAESLKPLPVGGMTEGGASKPATTPAATGGLTVTPGVDATGQPENYNGPRRSEARPLPQLKFVPKAEPLKTPDEVIEFEDEKSKL